MRETTPDVDLWTRPRWRAEDLGAPLPPSPHANSVCLPMWRDVIDYEEKRPRVLDRLQAGYPRFVIPPRVVRFHEECRRRFARAGEACLAYPSERAALRCIEAIQRWSSASARVEPWGDGRVFVVCYAEAAHEWAMKYWRHTGDGISSRHADALSTCGSEPSSGGALDTVRARIAALMDVFPSDVWLFPSGMAALYAVHRAVTRLRPGARSVQYGFPYVDTLKIQQDLGPGAIFFPFGNAAELPALADALAAEPVSGLFCEFPSNPLLGSPDLEALCAAAGPREVPVIVDDTISTYANVNPLPACDLVATSLTKFFTGRGDVMAGAVVLNPRRPLADRLRAALEAEVDPVIWGGDAVCMEAYSTDFVERMKRTNETTSALTRWLREQPEVAEVYYPEFRDRALYDRFRRPGGGYSGLFSLLLKDAAATSEPFFNRLRICKGPNLGTTFTLACPFTLLAHYGELDWAERCGVSRHLIRFSVGLEPADDLRARFEQALTSQR